MSSSNDFREVSVDCVIPLDKMYQMYQEWKKVVWLVVFRSLKHTSLRKIVCTRSAFSLEQNGFLLTASINCLTNHRISVRRLTDEDDFFYEAELVKEIEHMGIALIKIKNESELKEWVAGRFAENGRLFAGQTLFQVGNCQFLVGSMLIGKVAFPCEDGVVVPTKKLSSRTYQSKSFSLEWREIGEILNKYYWSQVEDNHKIYFEDRFHPQIQIIQLNNMEAGEGCQGSPLFNLNGEIVGMFGMNCGPFEIGIHLSVLKQFIRRISLKDMPIISQAESILGKRKSKQ